LLAGGVAKLPITTTEADMANSERFLEQMNRELVDAHVSYCSKRESAAANMTRSPTASPSCGKLQAR
jgi:hypothetical protein